LRATYTAFLLDTGTTVGYMVVARFAGGTGFDMGHVVRMANSEQCVAGREVIDEFPFFSYYLADLHPHVLAMPFALLAIGLALHLYFQQRRSPIEGRSVLSALQGWLSNDGFNVSQLALGQWMRRFDFWLAAITAGGLAFLNTWDFPIYVALFSAAYTLANYQSQGWSSRRIVEFIENGAALGIAGILLYLPFYIGFSSQAGGLLPSLSFFTRGTYFWVMFAPLLVPIIAWLIWLWARNGSRPALRSGLILSAVLVGSLWVVSYLFGGLALSMGGLGNSLVQGGSGIGMALRDLGGLFTNLQYGEAANLFANSPLAVIWNSIGRRLSSPGTWFTLFGMIAAVWGLLQVRKNRMVGAESPERDGSTPPVHAFVLLIVLVGCWVSLIP
jgi:hypothetical protein